MQIISRSVIMPKHHILMMLLILLLIQHIDLFLTLKKAHGIARLQGITIIPEYINLLVAMLLHHIAIQPVI